ncbi:hypothetical protein RhiJN_05676 [Ceratobasidium sp. AG-Ba]|nr:hypothetical protein RhiJN_05676 [Ceratobasidium sp. AG-Ba]QRW06606.1 hypothetical protein RhiLY_05605 [Ceratobasidium sp. AG-Ba]
MEPGGEYELLETRVIEGFGRTTFYGRTRRPRGAKVYLLFRNNLLDAVRLQAFLGPNEVVDTKVQSADTARLEGFII